MGSCSGSKCSISNTYATLFLLEITSNATINTWEGDPEGEQARGQLSTWEKAANVQRTPG